MKRDLHYNADFWDMTPGEARVVVETYHVFFDFISSLL